MKIVNAEVVNGRRSTLLFDVGDGKTWPGACDNRIANRQQPSGSKALSFSIKRMRGGGLDDLAVAESQRQSTRCLTLEGL